MSQELAGLRVAILATHGFESVELVQPRDALQAAGARVEIVSLAEGSIQGWNHDTPGTDSDRVAVDVTVDNAPSSRYDALLLPGGVKNPDTLRVNAGAVRFVKAFFVAEKPVAAICHGPWTLVEAGVVAGRKLTSWPSLKTDIINAGGHWVDEEVVNDHGLITSRKPQDLAAFSREIVQEFARKYQHA